MEKSEFNKLFIMSCLNHDIKTIHNLFTTTAPDIKKHANKNYYFQLACEMDSIPIIEYFITDLNIAKSSHIIKWLKTQNQNYRNSGDGVVHAQKFIEPYVMKIILEKDLKNKAIQPKKSKL